MIRRVFTIIIVQVSLVLAACQPEEKRPVVSLEEAKQITAEFQATEFEPPPRTVDDIVAVIGTLPKVPDNCSAIQREREAKIDEAAELLRSARSEMEFSLYGSVLESAARVELERGNFERTIEMIENGISAIPKSDAWGRLIELHTQLAGIKAALGDVSAARAHYRASRDIWDRWRRYDYGFYTSFEGESMRELLGAMAQGAIAQAEGKLVEAETHYRKIIDHYDYVGFARNLYFDDQRLAAELSGNLLKQGRLAEAELEARRGISAAFAYGFPRNPAQAATPIAQLAEVLLEQGRIRDAEKVARIAIALHEIGCSLPESLAFARALHSLAQVLAQKGDWQGVLEMIEATQAALAIKPDTFEHLFGGSAEWALALIHTGRTSEGLKRFEIALARRAEQYGEESYSTAEARGVLAMAHAAVGNTRQAFTEFSAALPLLTANRNPTTANTGQSTRGFRVNRILEAYMELLVDVRGTPVEAELGFDVAHELFRVAESNQTGTVQRALTAASARAAARDPALADLVRRDQDAAQELTVDLEALVTLSAAPPDQINTSLQRQLRERVEKLRAARLVLAKEIRSRFPEFAEIVNPGGATVADIQAVMRPGEALVATYLGEDRAYVWAVPHRGAVTFHTIDRGRDDIAFVVSFIRGALDAKARSLGDIPRFDLKIAHELYRSILQPVERGWRDARSLYVVAHGPLGQLPFSLLPTEPPHPSDDKELLFDRYRSVPWLARTHAVTVLPSAASLVMLRSTPEGSAARRAFAGFGDPWFRAEHAVQADPNARRGVALATRGDQSPLALEIRLRNTPATRGIDSAELSQLPRLPDTADEIKGIGAALNADLAQDIFIGKEASEDQVKTMNLSERKVIVFATHGLVPGDLNGLTQPALALSSPEVTGGEEDGLLTMGEILGLELDADWIVLSACNTAAAQGAGAEAVSGLGRAFFYAGSRSLLVSNWPVHSVSTTALTTGIFRRQAADRSLARAEALRLAMLAMIDGGIYADPTSGKALFSYAHPIFWAPFTLIGDSGAARPSS